jgi:hypothetical protein
MVQTRAEWERRQFRARRRRLRAQWRAATAKTELSVKEQAEHDAERALANRKAEIFNRVPQNDE